MRPNPGAAVPISDRRLIETQYHRKLNLRLVMAVAPYFLFFAIFYYVRANYLQSSIFAILTLNAIASLCLAPRMSTIEQLTQLKRYGGAIAFGFLAVSILASLSSGNFYVAVPWLFIYLVAVLLFFGERIGICYAIFLCAGTAVTLCTIDLPPLTPSVIITFKTSLLLALSATLVIGLVSERARVRMRNHLIEARNNYKFAEGRQRETNEELKHEIAMRLRSEAAMAQGEARYRALFEESAVSLWEEDCSGLKRYLDDLPQEAVDDLEGYFQQHPEEIRKCIMLSRVMEVNRATLGLYGADSKSTLLKNVWQVLPTDLGAYVTGRLSAFNRRSRYQSLVTAQTLWGQKLFLLVGSTVPAGYEDTWEKVYTSVFDMTERVAMEEERKLVDRQLQHTRQIQAIASLAGGIAHQFNNALAVIWGNLDLLERKVPRCEKIDRHFGFLRSSSEHMRRLTEQLLAYAKGGKYQPLNFSLNKLIREILKANKLTRQPSFNITQHLEGEVILASSDITQIRIVLDAVLANAAEAMPDGGEIIITARCERVVDVIKGGDTELPPGNYAIITFEDHGLGMDEETRQRIFEPFFTTKFVGRGLGMAAAYGIVRNHDGLIDVSSKRHQGTRVTIYLPSAAPTQRLDNAASRAAAA